ncbi:MAG: rhodanese-like domain-containing protein [Coleofasciculus sp. A1-SPW-01]|uniref:rhodanese-like domain-containing protein n=1 Tax=Coleofasciculus sp. A1-SPW-01 TaxID=3070819 RepID=UPI0032FDE329
MEELSDRATASLEPQREIYVYGDNDQQSNQAASQLREAGFESVSVLKGGLTAWKAISSPTEGSAEQR